MLSENLKNLRKAKGVSQEALAAKLHVVRQTVSKWEKGLSVPDSQMLIRIAKALDTSIDVLLGEPPTPREASRESLELQAIEDKLEALQAQLAERCDRQRKRWRTAFLVFGIIALVAIFRELAGIFHGWAAMEAIHGSSVAIGGYDGPTNLYVFAPAQRAVIWMAALLALLISAVGICKTRRK